MKDGLPPDVGNFTHKDIEKLIGDQGEKAYEEMAEQFPDVFRGVPPESFLSIYNAAFLIGFRNAEVIYRVRLLGLALEGEREEEKAEKKEEG